MKPMTVKELIAALQELPQDSIVVLEGYDDGMLYQEELRTVQVKWPLVQAGFTKTGSAPVVNRTLSTSQ